MKLIFHFSQEVVQSRLCLFKCAVTAFLMIILMKMLLLMLLHPLSMQNSPQIILT